MSLSQTGERFLDGGGLETGGRNIDLSFWVGALGVSLDQLVEALSELARLGLIDRQDHWNCPDCEHPVFSSDNVCSVCGCRRPPGAVLEPGFQRRTEPSRDPGAVLLVHGMNSFGPWQESLSWRFALLYGYSLPVFSFKYGRDVFSPFSSFAQRQRVKQLGNAVRRVQDDLKNHGRTAPCDVIAHSFGTLLFAALLESPAFADLRFGRVVLAGSIVRQRFPWSKMIKEGRVEAVLNHRAARDFWVPLAPWAFPNSGESGIRGFEATADLTEIESRGLGHTDYFEDRIFSREIRLSWTPFLEAKQVRHATATAKIPTFRWWLRWRYWTVRVLLVAISAAIARAFA